MNNAVEVLKNVEKLIETGHGYANADVCGELSIFDWWNDYLSLSQLKDMRRFLREAIKLGYTGYVCFTVGAKDCSNGMWAYKEESKDGFSPDGEALYKSFVSGSNYWCFCTSEGKWIPEGEDSDGTYIKTVKALEEAILNCKLEGVIS